MTVDTQKSLLEFIYSYLTNDAALKLALGGTVSLYPIFAPNDTPMPYLVQKLDFKDTEFFPVNQGTLQFDLWSRSPNADQILSMRKRLIEMLDQYNFDTDEVKGVRVWKYSDGFVPDDPGIWHYVILFSIRLYRASEVAVII
jgi:hypothetical protein